MKKIINTPQAPDPIGPYSQAVKAGGFLFVSGQVALIPETMEMITGDIEKEAEQVMQNLKHVLEEAETDFSHVVKTSIFLSDMTHFENVNKVYSKYFTSDFPARETVAVKTLPKNGNVEISLIVEL